MSRQLDHQAKEELRYKRIAQKGTLKLNGWKPQRKPNEAMCKILRQDAIEAVFALHHQGKTAYLQNIYTIVKQRIHTRRKNGKWPPEWGYPGKRTIDRRVNEAARGNTRLTPLSSPKKHK